MSDLLKNPTLASNLIALRSKTLPAHERKALALTVLEQMRDLVNEAQDLIHELKLPDGLSSVLHEGVRHFDSNFETATGAMVDTVDHALYTLDYQIRSLGSRNGLWLRERGTTYDRARDRRKAAREAAQAAADSPFAGADAAEFGPAASHTPDFRREAEDCGGDIESQYPDPTVRKVHACKCDCDPHVGPVQQVQVSSGMRDWGTYWYCQTAINEDRQRGLIVEVVEPATERQGVAR